MLQNSFHVNFAFEDLFLLMSGMLCQNMSKMVKCKKMFVKI